MNTDRILRTLQRHKDLMDQVELAANVDDAAGDPMTSQAAERLAWLFRRGEIKSGCTQREIYRMQRSGLSTKEAVFEACKVLESIGFLFIDSVKGRGKPSNKVILAEF